MLDPVGNVSSNVCNDDDGDDDDDDDGDDNNGGSESAVLLEDMVCVGSLMAVEDKVTKGDISKNSSRAVMTDSFNHSTSRSNF